MNNYLILICAFIIGQLLYTAITVYNLQRGKAIDYQTAFKAYVKKELGGYIVAIVGLAALMFILSDFVDPNFKKEDADIQTWKGRVVAYFRTSALFFGVFAQHIIFKVFKRGKKEIEKLDEIIEDNKN